MKNIINHFKKDLAPIHERLYQKIQKTKKEMLTYKEDIYFNEGYTKRIEYYVYKKEVEDVRIQIRDILDGDKVIGDVEDDINVIQFYLQEAIKYIDKKKKK